MVDDRTNRNISILPRSQNEDLVSQRLAELREHPLGAQRGSSSQRVDREKRNARRMALRAVERSLKFGRLNSPLLFLSYTGLGSHLAEVAKKKAEEYGFQVATGFDAEVEIGGDEDASREATLPELIMSRILSSSCFLGIWTPDFNAESVQGRDGRGNFIEAQRGTVPGVWMPFELGVAAAHDLKIRLLVQDGTHKGYYEKPFSLKPQVLFNSANFHEKLDRALRYFDLRIKSELAASSAV